MSWYVNERKIKQPDVYPINSNFNLAIPIYVKSDTNSGNNYYNLVWGTSQYTVYNERDLLWVYRMPNLIPRGYTLLDPNTCTDPIPFLTHYFKLTLSNFE